jgi:hypothetical protein
MFFMHTAAADMLARVGAAAVTFSFSVIVTLTVTWPGHA